MTMSKPLSLPVKPCGYQILVKMQKPREKTRGGIIVPDETKDIAEMKGARGQVVDLGPDAYTGNHQDGSKRFPTGPYCKAGDWVEWNRYQERRLHVEDQEYALIHDDRILAVWTKEPPVW